MCTVILENAFSTFCIPLLLREWNIVYVVTPLIISRDLQLALESGYCCQWRVEVFRNLRATCDEWASLEQLRAQPRHRRLSGFVAYSLLISTAGRRASLRGCRPQSLASRGMFSESVGGNRDNNWASCLNPLLCPDNEQVSCKAAHQCAQD
mgnify:CR=1 FL=1